MLWTISFLCFYYHLESGASGTNSKLIAEKGKFGLETSYSAYINQENKFFVWQQNSMFWNTGTKLRQKVTQILNFKMLNKSLKESSNLAGSEWNASYAKSLCVPQDPCHLPRPLLPKDGNEL